MFMRNKSVTLVMNIPTIGFVKNQDGIKVCDIQCEIDGLMTLHEVGPERSDMFEVTRFMTIVY